MKKLLTFIIYSSLFLYAENASSQVKYDKGNILVNGGIGVGYYYGSGGLGLPIFVSGEYAITDAISVGPYLAYTSRSYSNYSFKYRYTFIDFGVRGAYHYGKHLNLRTDKLDLYGGVFLGYIAASSKLLESPAYGPYGFTASYYNSSAAYGSTIRAGIFAGARYYFTDQFAAMAELGYGIAPLSLGVTFKF